MTQEERIKEYVRLCDEAHSNLEAPLLGEIRVPICKSCIHADYHYGTLNEPECAIYGKMPDLYRNAKKYDCPRYEQIQGIDDAYLPVHMRKGK